MDKERNKEMTRKEDKIKKLYLTKDASRMETIDKMTKKEVLTAMYDIAMSMMKEGYTYKANEALWEMASDYNTHHEDEIFMAEKYNDEDEMDGFYIEDDYFLFENM